MRQVTQIEVIDQRQPEYAQYSQANWSIVQRTASDADATACVVVHRFRLPTRAVDRLTPREQQVLSLLADGQPHKIAAYELQISVSTVAMHVSQAARKLGVRGRLELQLHEHVRHAGAALEPEFDEVTQLAERAVALCKAVSDSRPRLMRLHHRAHELAVFMHQQAPKARRKCPALDAVSAAEAEVLMWALLCESNASIAERLAKSRHTIANQLSQIFKKLKVSSRAQAIALCCESLGCVDHL